MHFPDLSTVTPVASGAHVRAVGWLGGAPAYPRGRVDEAHLARLDAYASRWGESVDALGWPVAGGAHTCELCGRAQASGNFGVPAGDVLYVCPELIAHYVRAHGYRPPSQFLDALAAAPLPGGPEYLRAVARFPR